MTDPAELVARATEHMNAGEFSLALHLANEAIESEAFDDAWATRGGASFALGDLPDAEYCYVKAIELSPSEPIYREGLGRVYLEQDKHELALESFSHAVSLDANAVDSQVGVVIALSCLDRTNDARDHATKLASSFPGNPTVVETYALTIVESVRECFTQISDGSTVVTSQEQYDRLIADVALLRGLTVQDPELSDEIDGLADMARSDGQTAWAPDRPYFDDPQGKVMAIGAIAVAVVAAAIHPALSILAIFGMAYMFFQRYRVPLWKGREAFWRGGFDAQLSDQPRTVERWGIGH